MNAGITAARGGGVGGSGIHGCLLVGSRSQESVMRGGSPGLGVTGGESERREGAGWVG